MHQHKRNIAQIFLIILLVVTVSSCVDDLNTSPLSDNTTTAASVYKTPDDFKKGLAKLYAGFVTTGQQGPAGDADIQGIDEGKSDYLRQFWNFQELPTDEAVNAFSDPGLPPLSYMSWTSSNGLNLAFYDRIFYEIALANEFIRKAKGNDNAKVQEYIAEARFIRAFSYWNALDFYGGNVPFVTEKNGVGAYNPKPVGSDSLFSYITHELKDIAPQLPAPKQNQYGRADQAAAWTLLAKLYLNSKVYTGTARYTQCITYTQKVIQQGGYSLDTHYDHLFLADNNTAQGVIFAFNADGTHTQTYGATNNIIHAAVGGSMNPSNFGIANGYAGNRVTSQFYDKFNATDDARALFYTDGQIKNVTDITDFTNGYAVTKWKNVTSAGTPGSKPAFVDTDYPIFRLADVDLMYAEAVLRGGDGGSMAHALEYVNDVRERGFGNASDNISASQLTLNFILNERARELYWEGHRRTDLIRFGEFTGGDYIWSWKGGAQSGTATNQKYQLLPIPASQLNTNPNLKQNPGY